MSDVWIEDWLGVPRFQKYVDSCSGDRTKALALYEWNVTLGQALMRDIAHFEIGLRNAYNTAFEERWQGSSHWLLDPDSPAVTPIWRIKKDRSGLKRGSDVNYQNRRSVDAAIRGCGGVRATPGKVMAELSFGFWRHLTSSSHEKTVWVPYLHHAYPPKTNRASVDRIIGNINIVRNRIAHHEPIFDRTKIPEQEPVRIQQDLMGIFSMIAPEAAAHLAPSSAVAQVLAQRP
ncbi:MAG: Abi family protein [Ancrocorticia sp.]|uniref:Abi family protein n=1 Tax=Ancrocorticia sp. TaxID=2593684 RepID=UPI003F9129A5